MLKNAAMKTSNHQAGLVQLIKKTPNKITNQPDKKNSNGSSISFFLLICTEEISQGTVYCTSNIPHKASKRKHIEWPNYPS